ncbi:helix-turn-helix domain-containing protein, partial [Escherichia coli]|nr:helix-turn-helix domain-containing protein [Escherichia coli]
MTSLKTSIKTITYLSDIGCLEIQGASLIISARFGVPRTQVRTWVALYEKHGEKGLIPKPKGVSA